MIAIKCEEYICTSIFTNREYRNICITLQNNDSITANIRKWHKYSLHSRNRNVTQFQSIIIAGPLSVSRDHSIKITQKHYSGRSADVQQERMDFECMSDPRRVCLLVGYTQAHTDVTIIIDPRQDQYQYHAKSFRMIGHHRHNGRNFFSFVSRVKESNANG